jgi:thiol-disulfide isomerase/thioredoxin
MNDRLADNTIASALFTNDGFERLTESFLTARIAGERSDRGTTCTVVQVTEENGTSELLIRNGEEPLIQTFTHRGEKSSVTMTFLKWEVNKPIPEELFKFIPPADAQKISSVEDELRRLSGDDYPALKLLGAAPPPFELPALGGDTVSLSKHLGKNIIVLDFWATWCPPCRAALPGLVEVTDSLADKGVVFYAINLRENEGVVRDFMKKQKKQFLVLMDNGDVAAAYKVEPIPQNRHHRRERHRAGRAFRLHQQAAHPPRAGHAADRTKSGRAAEMNANTTTSAPLAVTWDDVASAAERLRGVAHHTPVMTSGTLNEKSGVSLFFKCENLQLVGAFKSAAPTTR